MKKSLLFASLVATASLLLAGCSTSRIIDTSTNTSANTSANINANTNAPEFAPVIQSTLLAEMQKLSNEILAAGGLAVVGTSESKSLALALDRAKVNGRLELALVLAARVGALDKAFTEETGMSADALILSGFNSTTKIITSQQITGSIAQVLKYETIGDTSTAYALMVLDPKAIADQLAKEKELYARLQKTSALGELNKEIKAYEAFKATQK